VRPLRGKTKKPKTMAIYHLSMKTISRSAGRSSTAAAAYRSASEIVDRRTGEVHDYRRKAGVESSALILPDGCAELSRADLWNGVEQHHKRGDAVVARELEVALPAELSAHERERLAADFAREVANHYRVAADVCIHLPGKEGDDRNHHAHIMLSACTVSPTGFGKKAADLDPIHCQRQKIPNPADLWRARWAELTNERLRENGIDATIDHRSLEAQGIDRVPTVHVGPSVTAIERRDEKAEVTARIEKEVAARQAAASEAKEIERQVSRLEAGQRPAQATQRHRYKSVPLPERRSPTPKEVEKKGIRWLWQVAQRRIQTLVKRMVEAVEAKRQAARLDGIVHDLSGNLDAAKTDRDQLYVAAAREYAAGAVAEFKADLAEQARIERAKEQARAFVIELATPKPERKKEQDGPSGPSMG